MKSRTLEKEGKRQGKEEEKKEGGKKWKSMTVEKKRGEGTERGGPPEAVIYGGITGGGISS